jgi:putative oxidoreductase
MMRFFVPAVGERASIGLLLVRLIVGVAFIIHGYPKIEHPMSWMPNSPFPPMLLALAAFAEFAGGIALIAGLLTPLFALLIAVDMAVAILVEAIPHGTPFIAMGNSYESAAFYLVVTLALVFTGPGRYSLDAMIARTPRARRSTLSHA